MNSLNKKAFPLNKNAESSKSLRIVAPFHNIGGYSHAARGLLAAALVAGYTVEAVESETNEITDIGLDWSQTTRLVPKFPDKPIPECQAAELQAALRIIVPADAPTVLMGNPGMMADYPEYCDGPRVGYTMLESDTLHPLWAQACRNVDLLLAPSRWCVDTIQRAVPDVQVELLPICVDERLWSPEGPKREISTGQPPFLFLSVFSTCERKGWRKTIQAFAEEFRGENVGLVLKPTRVAEVEELADWARSMGAGIEIVKGELTDDEMASLYRACDVYVSPSAEGFGVPVVEAAMCSLPSIFLDAGGCADFVSKVRDYPVESEWVPAVGHLPQIYPSSHQWPTCTVERLKQAMRDAYRLESAEKRFPLGDGKVYGHEFGRTAVASRLNELKLERTSAQLPSGQSGKHIPLTVVITTHNHLESTKRLVESLRKYIPRSTTRIVLADDGSTDGTVEWAREAGLEVVECDSGGNVSANRQQAIDYLRLLAKPIDSPICFMDNDIEVAVNWWVDLSAIMRANPKIGILAPRKIYGADTQSASGTSAAPEAEAVQNIGNRLYFNCGSFPLRLERPLAYPDYVESACMVVSPEVWRSCEWDGQFPIFYEDVDYCFQARAAGWEVCATNAATVIHHAHTTSNARAQESDACRRKFMMKWKERL